VLYLVLLGRSRRLRILCGVQIWIDSMLVTALVHYTGGIDSFFAFVYIFPILAAAIFLSRRSSVLLAGWNSVLYGGVISLQPPAARTIPATLSSSSSSILWLFFSWRCWAASLRSV
jgi:hypothetical protein